MKYQNYEEFIRCLNKQVSTLSVPCEVRNFADWQPNLYVKFADMGTDEQVIKEFIKDYNELNNTIYGNLYNLMRKEYLYGRVPCGCSFYSVPQSEKYTALRNKLLSIADEIKACGFEIKGDICNSRHSDEIEFPLWNNDIEKARDYQYHLAYAGFELESKYERMQERAYEDMIIRNN